MDMFFQDDDETIVIDNQQIDLGNTSQSYEELVKDFMLEENQYLRDLNMIIRVFREPFVRLYSRSKVYCLFQELLAIMLLLVFNCYLDLTLGMLIPGKSYSRVLIGQSRDSIWIEYLPVMVRLQRCSLNPMTTALSHLPFGGCWIHFAGYIVVSSYGRAGLMSTRTLLRMHDGEQTLSGPCKPFSDMLWLPLNVGLKVRSHQTRCDVSHCATQCNASRVNKLLWHHVA